MIGKIKRRFKKRNSSSEIAPDEIFLDSSNLPQFDRNQFEGRIEKPISRRIIAFTGLFFLLIGVVFTYKVWNLQITQGAVFTDRSENNRLRHTIVFSDRGVISDRNKNLLAWNEENPIDSDYSFRKYSTTTGLSNIIGYVKYPSKDSAGFYYREDYLGMDGVEKYYENRLQGTNGLKIKETDVYGKVISESTQNPPKSGDELVLSIDSRIQSKLYDTIEKLSKDVGFVGGAGVIMNIHTGEIITEVSYPEYDSQTFTDGTDHEKINAYFTDKATPLLDRATSGLYVPGSIVKPFMALGALNEGIIGANDVIYTNGSLVLHSPYNPDQTFVYRDWKNHGAVDMRRAIAVSSDVYFYQVGGGFKDQKGIGIANIEKYMRMFGFGEEVGPDFFGTKKGVIPNPDWKEANFNGDIWRVGDTYHTVIGQYGFQVTPMQVVRAVGALANKGVLLEPTVIANDKEALKHIKKIELPQKYFDVVHEGMRLGATEGTAASLNVPYVEFAAKTGTAELGVSKEYVNSWVTGFFPYKNPQYAFVILMEKGHKSNLVGASYVGRQLFDWMSIHAPEYFESK
ncbi:MAG: penicillin-binding transpeptidase domain-containing protein [bacterium]|nr:penicillin-binding transpeptidase domain-containing protein [bacterium]